MDYVLVTPAKNEEAFIERTLSSVVSQSHRPLRWVIVSDGSTDKTDEIVQRYVEQYSFIRLLRRESSKRHFGNKVYAFEAGYALMADLSYDFVGNLDADIELPPDYYEIMLDRFQDDEKLGLIGGIRVDLCDGEFVEIRCATNSVGGPYQFFRKACYEGIGGYKPLKLGGVDAVAEIMARQKGWTVRSYSDVVARHYRCTGTAKGNKFQAAFRGGKKLYVIGYHPMFEIVKLARVKSLKSALRNLCELAGYSLAAICRYEKQVPREVITYLHQEQKERLAHLFRHRKDPARLSETVM